jgi:hypothetical protein
MIIHLSSNIMVVTFVSLHSLKFACAVLQFGDITKKAVSKFTGKDNYEVRLDQAFCNE